MAEQKTSVLVSTHINGEELQGEAQAHAALAKTAQIIDPKVVLADEEAPDLCPVTGVPKVLKSCLVLKDPDVYLIPNFVSDAEIEHLLLLSEEFWVPSTVGTGVYKTNDESKDLKNKSSQNRTSFSCMLKSAQTQTIDRIEKRISAIAGLQVDYLERLNMVRYYPGQFFNKHHDGKFRPKTVFIYLNDLPEDDDGETFFPELKLKFKPSKGCAIMWSNTGKDGNEDMRMVHQGLPPRTGVKFGVNCFFNDKSVRQYEEQIRIQAEIDQEEALEGPGNYVTVDPQTLGEGEAAVPGQLRSFTVLNDPKISVVPNLLSAEETAALRAVLTKEDIPDQDEQIFGRIEQRLAAVAGMNMTHMEPLTVAKSTPGTTPDGEVFARGKDGSYTAKFGNKTVSIFLNDVAEGGELRFRKLNFQVRPREGAAVVWSATQADGSEDLRAVHQGRPPKEGTRYSATAVFRSSAVREIAVAS